MFQLCTVVYLSECTFLVMLTVRSKLTWIEHCMYLYIYLYVTV